MNQKRMRSLNWDEDEKKLFRSVLKQFSQYIENKSLDTNAIKAKNKAWEEVHKKFNELNSRHRKLSQLKIKWKAMKINARKKHRTFRKELNKTGSGARPTTPNDKIIEKHLLNPAELLRDFNIYDSDTIIRSTSETTSETCAITLQPVDSVDISPLSLSWSKRQDSKPVTHMVKASNTCLNNIVYLEDQLTDISQVNATVDTPMKTNLDTIQAKDHDEYVNSMLSHSKMLKDEEHLRHMEMAVEEHAIKMAIYREKLRSAILERETLELKKASEMKHIVFDS